MLFRRIKRSGADSIFSIVYNVAAATITAGYPCVLNVSSPDGVSVSKPAAATLSLLLGVAVKNILDSSYGKIQVYGYKASVYVTNQDSADTAMVDIAAGDILIPVDAQWYLTRSGASDGKTGFICAAETIVSAGVPAAANHKCFIRCL
jgi:hypothetical protein